MMFKYILCISIFLIVMNSGIDYGEFDFKITNFKVCKGPKRRYCTEITTRIVNSSLMNYDILVKENMTTIKGIIIGTVKNKDVIRYRVTNLCDHVFYRPLIQAMYNITDRCGIFQGHYSINVDVQAITRSLYGAKYMYGNWTFKTLFYNDNCNMYCIVMQAMVTPKNSISV